MTKFLPNEKRMRKLFVPLNSIFGRLMCDVGRQVGIDEKSQGVKS